MTGKKILTSVSGYAEDYETMVPLQALQMTGYQADAVYPDKAAGDYIVTAIHDPDSVQTYSEKPGYRLILNASFAAVKTEGYDTLIVPGDRASEYLCLDKEVVKLVQAFNAVREPIAIICHGPQPPAVVGTL